MKFEVSDVSIYHIVWQIKFQQNIFVNTISMSEQKLHFPTRTNKSLAAF